RITREAAVAVEVENEGVLETRRLGEIGEAAGGERLPVANRDGLTEDVSPISPTQFQRFSVAPSESPADALDLGQDHVLMYRPESRGVQRPCHVQETAGLDHTVDRPTRARIEVQPDEVPHETAPVVDLGVHPPRVAAHCQGAADVLGTAAV